jgi:hypothetical protein
MEEENQYDDQKYTEEKEGLESKANSAETDIA